MFAIELHYANTISRWWLGDILPNGIVRVTHHARYAQRFWTRRKAWEFIDRHRPLLHRAETLDVKFVGWMLL